ncbi:MAG TPA: hypothetical protein VMU87_11645 [Stellaceae bacterium]|nr:hypothetical protein [Stellaceae bacterium]
MRIVITGGAGFIGQRLAAWLLARGTLAGRDGRPDPAVQRIVDGWPRACAATRARRLSIEPDPDIDAIVAAFIADDLDAQKSLIQAGVPP